jgi:hypothetical protein
MCPDRHFLVFLIFLNIRSYVIVFWFHFSRPSTEIVKLGWIQWIIK